MSRQPTIEEVQTAEDVIRRVAPVTTIGVQPCNSYLSGELWTVHLNAGGQFAMGQGGTLVDAMKAIKAVDAPRMRAAS